MSLPVRVEWDMDAEKRAAIEAFLLPALRYLPPWCVSVYVRFDPDESQLAGVRVLPEYRTVNIRFGSAWFSESEHERRVAIMHEVLHSHVEALSVVFDDMLKAAGWDDTGPIAAWAREQWRRAEEGAISDLSRVLVE